LTILRKREAFRRSFAGFDFKKVARFGSRQVERMLEDASIVRHRGKIESTIGNARRALSLVDEFGSIAAYVWRYEPDRLARPRRASTSPEAVALSKDLKKRGWTFVGPTTLYAFMQAMGLVNDHLDGCVARPRAEKARRGFRRP
jgi:DNA-3-methyladenine glycosylase I